MILKIRGELKIETESGITLSPLLITLLKQIDKAGSLNTAAKEIGMVYSQAWNTLYKINCILKSPLVTTQRGGKGGGVATLTESGKNLIVQYEQIKNDFQTFLNGQSIDL